MSTATTEQAYIGDELELFRDAVHWKAYFSSKITPYLKGDVLEVGAGLGETTKYLCDGSQKSWVCLEPDRDLLSRLEARDDLPQCCVAKSGILQDLPEEPRYDAILYIDVLEHIEHDLEELRQASLRLAPQGRILVLSPAYQWLYSPFDKAIGHYRRYSKGSLRAVIPSGLRAESIRYLDSVGVMASGMNRFLMKQGMPTPGQIRLWDRVFVRASRVLDPLTFHSFGKTILASLRHG